MEARLDVLMFDREKASVREGEVLKGNPSWELRRHDAIVLMPMRFTAGCSCEAFFRASGRAATRISMTAEKSS